MSKVLVKRNPIHPYTYKNPDDLPHIKWKLVSKGVAYNMIYSKQICLERAKKGEYEYLQQQMKQRGFKIL